MYVTQATINDLTSMNIWVPYFPEPNPKPFIKKEKLLVALVPTYNWGANLQ